MKPHLGIIIELGDAPLIVGRVHDPQAVREIITRAIAAAEKRARHCGHLAAFRAQQEVRMLRNMLTRLANTTTDTSEVTSKLLM